MADAVCVRMRTIPNTRPSPRLLYSVVPDLPATKNGTDEPPSRARLIGSGAFSGSGAIIFVGILVGALLFSAVGIVFSRHFRQNHQPAAVPKRVEKVSQKPSPKLIFVQLPAGTLKVSSISLGHPRLAVINGKTAAEGDSITVVLPGSSATVELRVVNIADSRIDLSDGTKVFAQKLNLAPRK